MIRDIKEYEIIEEVELKEFNSTGILLKHRATGARVALIPNDDSNKTFCIGFRTPAPDDTGVPHIIEHTVLCGSKKFNVKDPFIELLKGSLNTFLNAMTYPDKTVYPVASTNETDFHNLVDIYMDAVFNPNIYKHEEIFRQEGWNYNIESEDEPLSYNGVVYNEMKGAFSSPEDVLERRIMHSLYPDTCYVNESGGDPECIPDLTYEDYLDFHRTYYHPSNCYIYLYGDMDMEEYLRWFDKEYLSGYDYLEVDSEIKLQKPFESTVKEVASYSITENESLEDNTYLSYNAVTGESGDKVEYMAYKVLDYALFSMPGAPVKQALLDAGIGNDIYGSYADFLRQPYFSIVAKNANEEDADKFVEVIRNTLENVVSEGINEESLRAGINVFEFQFKEADFGSYPKGIMYGLSMFDSWLYDDNQAFTLLQMNEAFRVLKEKIGTGYYEDLIKQSILDNPHSSLVIVKPERGMTTRIDQEVSDRLRQFKKTLSAEQVSKMVEDTKKLLEYQRTPADPEELKKIPLLKISDIKAEAEDFDNEVQEVEGVQMLTHKVFTNGIAYVDMMFNTSDMPKELLPYMGLLKATMGYMDTTKHSYSEIANLINLNSGGVALDISLYPDTREKGKYKTYVSFRNRVMYDRVAFAFAMVEEIINDTIFDNEKRLLEIVSELKSRMEMMLNQSGNSAAMLRSKAVFSDIARDTENMKGINYYLFICDLVNNFDKKKKTVIENLKKVTSYIFRKDNLFINCTCNDEGCKLVASQIVEFKNKLNGKNEIDMKGFEKLREITPNEGFKTSAQIQYVVCTGDFALKGYEFSGAVKVLMTILNYEYLWNSVRVEGGAYGCSSSFTRLGEAGFASYRDPNLEKTLDNYRKIPEYIEKLDISDRDMTKFIIGTISGMDTPLTPYARGNRSLAAYMNGLDYSIIQNERTQVLNTSQEDIKNLAPLVKAVLDMNNICVIGNEDKIEEAKELFSSIKNLFA